MFEADPFAKRERALEDEFFHRVDEKLRNDLRRSMEREQSREAIVAATGMDDQQLIDELLNAGMDAASLVAITMVPSIFVAWADGNVTEAERDTVLRAAGERGIGEDHLARQLLESWLHAKPPKGLWETWKHYAKSAGQSLSDATSQRLAEQIIQQATWVAKASGGMLGIGKVSAEEQKVLDEVKQTLA